MDSSVDISPNELTTQARGDHGEGEAACFVGLPSKTKELERIQPDEHRYVQDLVSQNKVVVFSKTHCPHCTDSKSLLSTMGVDYKTVELDEMNNGSQVQSVLGSITNARTVPRIFIDGQCVGGNSDLKSLDKSGQLEVMLKKDRQ